MEDGAHTHWERTPEWYQPRADACAANDPAGVEAFEGSTTDRERIAKTASALADADLPARTRARARQLVEEQFSCCEVVAQRLLAHETLTADDVRATHPRREPGFS
jgi:hypothetical protein